MQKKDLNYHEKYQHFYNSKSWHDLRNFKWQESNGLCEKCYKQGIIKASREIHHIVPIEVDWSKRLEYENLIALCSDCHNFEHLRISPLQKFLRDWENI